MEMKFDRKDLMALLELGFEIKRPYFIWGSMGIGKSYSVREFARKKAEQKGKKFVEWNNLTCAEKKIVFNSLGDKFLFIDLRASEVNLDDFKVPRLDGDYFEWKIPLVFALVCQRDAEGILFFDEFNLARPSIQSMFYQLINDRQIGEHRLSDGVYVVGAGNNPEDSNAVFELSKPLLDRFEHIELKPPSIDEWTEWAVDNVDNEVISFLNFKPQFLFAPDDSKAFATPRGWQYVSDALKQIKKKGEIDYDLLSKLAFSYVGFSGLEFSSFVKLKLDININEILDKPEKIDQYVGKKDVLYSVVSAIAEKIAEQPEKIKKAVLVFDRIPVEFAVFGLKLAGKLTKGALLRYNVDLSKYTKWLV